MKLEKFADALNLAHKEFGLDSTDVLILNAILDMRSTKGCTPTMHFAHTFEGASVSTTLSRVQALIRGGWIIRTSPAHSPRMKNLEPSEKVGEFIDYLARV